MGDEVEEEGQAWAGRACVLGICTKQAEGRISQPWDLDCSEDTGQEGLMTRRDRDRKLIWVEGCFRGNPYGFYNAVADWKR